MRIDKKAYTSHPLECFVNTNAFHNRLLTLTVKIVTAHVANCTTPIDELPNLINDVYAALAAVEPAADSTVIQPTVQTHAHTHAGHAAENTDDLLVCRECGVTMKMLKRHLVTVHGMTPEDYRAKWGLPHDYPMVAKNYAKLRSALARESGLGLRPEARSKRRHA
jgi:predicted transcriptional regulator